MRKRGRKSSAELSVVPIDCKAQRPPPPADLTPAQAKIWTDIVDTSPAGWFRDGDVLLGLYCRHVHTGNQLAKLINDCKVDLHDLQRLGRLLAMRDRETRMMMSLATKMRLTQQARITPRSAGRQMEETGRKLWERKPWDLAD